MDPARPPSPLASRVRPIDLAAQLRLGERDHHGIEMGKSLHLYFLRPQRGRRDFLGGGIGALVKTITQELLLPLRLLHEAARLVVH